MRYTKEYLEEKYSPEQLDEFIGGLVATAVKGLAGIGRDILGSAVASGKEALKGQEVQAGFAGKEGDTTKKDVASLGKAAEKLKQRVFPARTYHKPTPVELVGGSDLEKAAKERRKKKK